jgi:hypothetical protein
MTPTLFPNLAKSCDAATLRRVSKAFSGSLGRLQKKKYEAVSLERLAMWALEIAEVADDVDRRNQLRRKAPRRKAAVRVKADVPATFKRSTKIRRVKGERRYHERRKA